MILRRLGTWTEIEGDDSYLQSEWKYDITLDQPWAILNS
jgi:hypothetical protein